MAKASLKQLAMNLACEWALDGIRVNCIAPGYIDTSLLTSVPSFLALLVLPPDPHAFVTIAQEERGFRGRFVAGDADEADGKTGRDRKSHFSLQGVSQRKRRLCP